MAGTILGMVDRSSRVVNGTDHMVKWSSHLVAGSSRMADHANRTG
jgi:hypothetical protein